MQATDIAVRDAVLAIDDDPELLELVRGCLEPSGFRVYTAVSGKEGIDFYEKNGKNVKLKFSADSTTAAIVRNQICGSHNRRAGQLPRRPCGVRPGRGDRS